MLPAALTVIVLLVVLLGLFLWNLHLANRLRDIEHVLAAEISPTIDALKKRTGT